MIQLAFLRVGYEGGSSIKGERKPIIFFAPEDVRHNTTREPTPSRSETTKFFRMLRRELVSSNRARPGRSCRCRHLSRQTQSSDGVGLSTIGKLTTCPTRLSQLAVVFAKPAHNISCDRLVPSHTLCNRQVDTLAQTTTPRQTTLVSMEPVGPLDNRLSHHRGTSRTGMSVFR